jgi:hypothetical protein
MNPPSVLARLNTKILLFILLALIIILQLWQIFYSKPVFTQTSAVPLASATPVDIFSSQTATIRGKITKIESQKLFITNDQNVTGQFDAGRVVLINDATNLQVASNTAELIKIPLNKPLVINLLYIDGRYVVTSLTSR